MGKASRDKGKRWERAVAAMLRPVFADAHRGQQGDGARYSDVEVPHLWLECKHGRSISPRAALRQAIDDTDGRIPVAVVRDHRNDKGVPPFVALRLTDFIELVRLAYGEEE